jgi:hypothetical protein
VGLIDEKTEGQKPHDTVPLREIFNVHGGGGGRVNRSSIYFHSVIIQMQKRNILYCINIEC